MGARRPTNQPKQSTRERIRMKEAWEEEQMSNLGCESVSDLIAEVKRLREGIKSYLNLEIETHELKELIE